MKTFFKAIVGIVLASMTIVSCGKDEPEDIDNLDYSIIYGASIFAYDKDYEVTPEQKTLFETIFNLYDTKFQHLPGYNSKDKYVFNISGTTLLPAMDIVKTACEEAENDIKILSQMAGTDIENLLEININIEVGYVASDKSVAHIYTKTWGKNPDLSDGI